jgi:NTP pyrophosphatase (non-canonical NTP hydrolase)
VDIEELSAKLEQVSSGYAARFGFVRDANWFLLKLHEEVGELTQAQLMRQGQARSKGLSPSELDARFCHELADVLSHVLLLAHHHGIDLEEVVGQKWLARLDDQA